MVVLVPLVLWAVTGSLVSAVHFTLLPSLSLRNVGSDFEGDILMEESAAYVELRFHNFVPEQERQARYFWVFWEEAIGSASCSFNSDYGTVSCHLVAGNLIRFRFKLNMPVVGVGNISWLYRLNSGFSQSGTVSAAFGSEIPRHDFPIAHIAINMAVLGFLFPMLAVSSWSVSGASKRRLVMIGILWVAGSLAALISWKYFPVKPEIYYRSPARMNLMDKLVVDHAKHGKFFVCAFCGLAGFSISAAFFEKKFPGAFVSGLFKHTKPVWFLSSLVFVIPVCFTGYRRSLNDDSRIDLPVFIVPVILLLLGALLGLLFRQSVHSEKTPEPVPEGATEQDL